MKKIFSAIFILILITGCKNGRVNQYSTYFINGESGDDSDSGTSPQKPWKSLSMINKIQLEAGDKVLLKSDQIYYGGIAIESISGTFSAPVVFSSYGKGRATIYSGDSAAFRSSNCEYLIFKNINTQGSGRLKGNKTNGVEFFKVRNGTIDSVVTSGYLLNGIQISGGENIRITNVHARDNGSCGINAGAGNKRVNDPDSTRFHTPRNIYVGHSVAENNPGCPIVKNNHSGNGILLGGVVNGLVEYCEAMNNGWDMPREGNGPVGIWGYMCDSLIIQHCYSHHNKTSLNGKDGGGFDFDGGITNSILQYNLSAFNEGAGYGIFQYNGASEWSNNIMRYNISYNDGSKNSHAGILMWCDPQAIPMKNFHAYNNTIVTNQGLGFNFEPGAYKDFIFENNIVLVTTPADKFVDGNYTLAVFKNNAYWAVNNAVKGLPQPKFRSDNEGIFADPGVVLPDLEYVLNFDLTNFRSYPFFKLKDGSICSKTGNKLPLDGGNDFWDNDIASETNIGADSRNSVL